MAKRVHHSTRQGRVPQATRLVKNSLIAIEQTDVDVDDPEAAAEEDALAAAAEARRSDGDAAHAGRLPADGDLQTHSHHQLARRRPYSWTQRTNRLT